jgi:hypothetical protein
MGVTQTTDAVLTASPKMLLLLDSYDPFIVDRTVPVCDVGRARKKGGGTEDAGKWAS